MDLSTQLFWIISGVLIVTNILMITLFIILRRKVDSAFEEKKPSKTEGQT